MFTPKSKQEKNVWAIEPGSAENPLWLLTPAELESLPPLTVLHSIFSEVVHTGSDTIEKDTRGGYLAYGVLESQLNNQEGK